MLKSLTAMAVLLANLGIAPWALAQAPSASPDHPMMKGDHSMMYGEGPRMKHMDERMWKKLGLSPEQKKKMDELHQQDLPKLKDLAKAVRTEHKSLMELFSSPKADDAAIKAQFDKLHAAKTQASTAHFNHMLAMRAILNPEQRQKFYGPRMSKMMDDGCCSEGEGAREKE